jgi:signal transduction histidine kinase
LAQLLADDPEWDVRREIADMLILLPDQAFPDLAVRFLRDKHPSVRAAALRALQRRHPPSSAARTGDVGTRPLGSELTALERIHGEGPVAQARMLAEELYDLLISEAVHELRGLITPLKSSAEALLQHLEAGPPDAAFLRDRLLRMEERLAFLERLIGDMREYSRRPAVQRKPARLAEMVSEAHALAIEQLQEVGEQARAVKVVLAVPEDMVITVARHQIVAALANVLRNALEAVVGRAGGRVALRATWLTRKAVMVTIEDNGPGRDAEELALLREFVPGRTSMKGRGTGFGLPIARRNVLAHGGSFDVDSRQGKGFVVTIVLPVQDREVAKP